MSLHIMYDHQCSDCEAYYIPYDNVPCPNCGKVEDERTSIISMITYSANYQKDCFNRYTPIAWWTGSFGDYVALKVFHVLDNFYSQDNKDFTAVSQEYVNQLKWGNQLYLKNHIRDIAEKVYYEIENKS